MKKIVAVFYFLIIACSLYSQTGSIQVTSVLQRTDGSGFVDIYFSLGGPMSIYNVTVEVSFNGGDIYETIPANYLSGHVNGIIPGNNKHMVWDGLGSFPNAFSTQTKLKITANPSGIAPVAAFTGSPTSGTAPLQVSFTDQSTNTPTSWLWEFGDGNSSSLQNPQYTYHYAGNYAVQLTVSNSNGSNTETKNEYISVTSSNGIGQPCPGAPTVTDIDGNTYNTILIGNQCWMKENLKSTHDAVGNSISRHCYDNNTDYCNFYGGIYTWYTLMNGSNSSNSNPSGVQGICPTGWHVPSDVEWTQLVDFLATQGYPNELYDGPAGKALRSCRHINSSLGDSCNTTEHPRWDTYSDFGFDEFGFSGLPTGVRANNGTYNNFGFFGYWWSSSEHTNPVSAIIRHLSSGHNVIGNGILLKGNGAGVRCIRD